MIAKIGRGANMLGALSYNIDKVQEQNGQVLYTQNMYETIDGKYTLGQLAASFTPNLTTNKRTKKPVLHISLNPDPNDKVSDQQFRQMAQEYMQEMGYGNQPFVVFKHTDTERVHIHIVSVCVDKQGKKISDKYEKYRSMEACRRLEQQYGLIPATEKQVNDNQRIFRPVDYQGKDLKSQIASLVRYLPKYYRYRSFGEYNALLSLFNITAEKVSGELHGKERKGLIYFALNDKGEKASNPFKSSLFGKGAGLPNLEKHMEQSAEKMKTDPAKAVLKNTVEVALQTTTCETDFKKQLVGQGINTVIRRNDEGLIYGVTFIDHESRSVWNGSRLDRKLSAKTFNDLWNGKDTGQHTANDEKQAKVKEPLPRATYLNTNEQPDEYFGYENSTPIFTTESLDWFSGLGGLLPDVHGDDYEELLFQRKMKKKKKRKKDRRH